MMMSWIKVLLSLYLHEIYVTRNHFSVWLSQGMKSLGPSWAFWALCTTYLDPSRPKRPTRNWQPLKIRLTTSYGLKSPAKLICS